VFSSMYRKETKENNCLFLLLKQDRQVRGSSNLYIHKNINGWVEYTARRKWCCLYSQNSLNEDKELQWQIELQNSLYICKSSILDKCHLLYNTLYVCKLISCNSSIETNYYACTKKDQIQLCYWCETMDNLSNLPRILTNRYKKVYPCCKIYKESGKDHFN
ncbi:1027_t:CDS:1, partial [Dentiscutata heterogama]